MAWIKLPAVSVANGDIVVSVTGGVDLSSVLSGWALIINGNYVEIKSGTSADGSGNSTLTLAEAWDGSTITNQPAKIMPTSAPALEIAQLMTDTNEYAIDVHNALSEAATKDKDITITDPTGADHTFASLPKSARLVQEAISENTEKVNALLANKTADGSDTTPGALLAVGATIQQLDLSNSNIEYVPDVSPILDLDFTNQIYRIYDEELGLVEKPLSDIMENQRLTEKGIITATGKFKTIASSVSGINFENGVCDGLVSTPFYTVLNTYSNDISSWNVPPEATIVENDPVGEIRSFSVTQSGSTNNGPQTNAVTLTANTTYYTTVVIDKSVNQSRYLGVVHKGFRTEGWQSGTVDLETGTGMFSVNIHSLIETDFFYILTLYQECDNEGGVGSVLFNARNSDSSVDNVSAIGLCGASITKTVGAPFYSTEGSAVSISGDVNTIPLGEFFNSKAFTIIGEARFTLPNFQPVIGRFKNSLTGENLTPWNTLSSNQTPPYRVYSSGSVGGSNPFPYKDIQVNDNSVPHLYAFSYDNGVYKTFFDGVLNQSVSGNEITSFDSLYVGWNGDSVNLMRTNYTGRLTIYPKALTEQELITMTGGKWNA